VILLGESKIVDDVPTACTNGRDKMYGRDFMASLTQPEMCGVVLHEALHVALKHIFRYPDLIQKDAQLANASMDYVVNAVIHNLTGYGQWIKLPSVALYDKQFDGWDVRSVFNFLNKDESQKHQQQQKQQSGKSEEEDENEGEGEGNEDESEGTGDKPAKPDKPKRDEVVVDGKSYKINTHDEHGKPEDAAGEGEGEALDEKEMKALSEEIDEAMQQSAILAGVMGMDLPQTIKEAMVKPVDWREVMAEFVTSSISGRDEYTWRRLNRRRLVHDIYMPDIESETVGEILVCIDTSGSTLGPVLDQFCQTLTAVAQSVQPDKIRVLFWDTEVRSEQVFTHNYDNLRDRLNPAGGGGTMVGCIPPYMMRNGIKPDCVLVLTDGYVEGNVQWDTTAPTLWVVTENKRWQPPKGRIVHTN
jgi:predicted metal-dependent peptidase